MESAIRKIVTFYQIVDALRTNLKLTHDSVDVALRWGQFCQKFYRESKDKPFFPHIRSAVVQKLTVTNVNFAAASSYRPSFEELENSCALVIITVLSNPFVSKDLFSYAVSLSSESCPSNEVLLDRISKSAAICSGLDDARIAEPFDFEVQMTSKVLVELAVFPGPNCKLLFETDEMKSFLTNKVEDVLREKKGHEFVVRLLLWLNAEERLCVAEREEEAIQFLTEMLTGFLLDNRQLFNRPIDRQLLHQLCVCDSRLRERYVEYLKERYEDDSNDCLESLKRTLADNGKSCAYLY